MKSSTKEVTGQFVEVWRNPYKWLPLLVLLLFVVLVILLMRTTLQRWQIVDRNIDNATFYIPIEDADPATITTDDEIVVNAAELVERAEDTQNTVDMLLGFLEAAAIIIGFALGAAALYGIRQTTGLEQRFAELECSQQAKIDALERTQQAKIDALLALEAKLQREIKSAKSINRKMSAQVSKTSLLALADQELRLRNYKEAYRFVERVLKTSPSNTLALYMAGWLETHQINGKELQGEIHLQRLLELDPQWPSANALYGVALRRKAMKQDPPNETLLAEAEAEISIALKRNPNLVDFNQESYWGPLGGIYRELDKVDEAIAAYRDALKVTRQSSYPQGNLAALMLRKSKDDTNMLSDAVDAFYKTIKMAENEIASKPNDYFVLMDLAQAHTIVSSSDRAHLEQGNDYFAQALSIADSAGILSVSLRGWRYLQKYMPDLDDWKPVEKQIKDCIDKLETTIKQLEVKQKAEMRTPLGKRRMNRKRNRRIQRVNQAHENTSSDGVL